MTDSLHSDLKATLQRRALLAASAGLAGQHLLADARGKHHKRRRRHHGGSAGVRTATAEQPDIVVFLTDDMRGDDWPILRQARERVGGTWFPNFCFDVAVCGACRATLLTGQHAHTHGVLSNGNADQRFRPHEADSLAPAIHGAGYHTAYVGKYINEYTGSRQPPGWDDWRAMVMKGDTYEVGGRYATSAMTARATDAVVAAPVDQPLFLFVSHHAPHVPHTPAKKYRNANVAPARNAADKERKRCLLSVDDSISAIAAAMGERWDSAVVLALSDNGYLLGEHGTQGKAIWWDEAARCPLLARLPSTSAATDERMVSSIDVCPTLLRAAGAEAWWPVQGRPLQETWQRDRVLIEGFQSESAGESRSPFSGIKGPGWVYVEPKGKPARYYADPGEQHDAIDTIDRAAYSAWLAELRAA